MAEKQLTRFPDRRQRPPNRLLYRLQPLIDRANEFLKNGGHVIRWIRFAGGLTL